MRDTEIVVDLLSDMQATIKSLESQLYRVKRDAAIIERMLQQDSTARLEKDSGFRNPGGPEHPYARWNREYRAEMQEVAPDVTITWAMVTDHVWDKLANEDKKLHLEECQQDLSAAKSKLQNAIRYRVRKGG